MADVKAPEIVAPVVLPPPRRKGRAEPATATAEVGRKPRFLTFLLAVMAAAGLLALVGSQLGSWHLPGSQPPDSGQRAAAVPKEESPVAVVPPVPVPAVAPGDAPGTAPGAAPGDAKPSPVGPAAGEARVGQANPGSTPPASPEAGAAKPAPAEPVKTVPKEAVKSAAAEPAPKTERATAPVRPVVPPEVSILSSPGGATATLDGNPSLACSTPCSLRAAAGRHTLALTLAGYQIERREFTVGTGPMELTPVALRRAGGTLMLTSVPDGAAISVDGKRIDQLTPAQIPLALGVYSIMIEKGGRQATEQVEIKSGMTTRKIILGQ
jgi:hypothetical protein